MTTLYSPSPAFNEAASYLSSAPSLAQVTNSVKLEVHLHIRLPASAFLTPLLLPGLFFMSYSSMVSSNCSPWPRRQIQVARRFLTSLVAQNGTRGS